MDAAAVNTTRKRLVAELYALGLPGGTWTGGRTRWNRDRFGLEKSHALPCASRWASLSGVDRGKLRVLVVRATGRGSHCRTNVWDTGFPRGYLTREKRVRGFATGDLVKAVVPVPLQDGRGACRAGRGARLGLISGWRD